MLNSTQILTETNNLINLSYEQVYSITSNPYFYFPIVFLIFLPIFIYFIWGIFSRVNSRHGKTTAIKTINFWIIFILFLSFGIILSILVRYPLWLKLPFFS